MFTSSDIEKLAELVKITVTQEEVEKLSNMLSQTGEYMDMLNELDTDSVVPTYQVTGLQNIFQNENLNKTLNQKDVLLNSTLVKNGMVGTSAVLEREE